MQNTTAIPDRTFICSVVFLDVISYSKESVSQQMIWKRELNSYIGEAITGIAESERVILDTGDGAALCFLGDPEIALVVALYVREAVTGRGNQLNPPMQMRMGINLGSVRLIRDLNGQQNIVGDGINVGQRVMSFAGINQLMASRSYYEVVSCLTDEYKNLFRYHGMCKDKHDREHEIYQVWSEREEQLAREKGNQAALVAAEERNFCEVILSPQSLKALEELLMPYVGPMAKILVSKATKSVDNLTELCINLGQQIPHEAQRNAFLGKALMIIQGQDVPVATETTSQPEAQKPAKVVAPIDKPQALKIIERELSLILGPLATSLVQRRSGTFQDIKELYTVLSQSIPNASERREFIEKVEAQLTPSKETVALFKPDGAPPAKTSTLNSSVVDTIAGELAIFLGPIAKTLVKREASLATSTEALIQRLKQHLSDPKEWDSFQRKLSTKIK